MVWLLLLKRHWVPVSLVVLSLGLLIHVRGHYLAEGRREGRAETLAKMEENWAARRAELESRRANIEETRRALALASLRMLDERDRDRRSMQTTLAAIERRRTSDAEEIVAIPGDQLVPAIRSALARLSDRNGTPGDTP